MGLCRTVIPTDSPVLCAFLGPARTSLIQGAEPEVTTEQRVRFATLCALDVYPLWAKYDLYEWRLWAEGFTRSCGSATAWYRKAATWWFHHDGLDAMAHEAWRAPGAVSPAWRSAMSAVASASDAGQAAWKAVGVDAAYAALLKVEADDLREDGKRGADLVMLAKQATGG